MLPFSVLEAGFCARLGTQLGPLTAAPITASVGQVKCWSPSPSVCIPGGGTHPVLGGGTAISPAPLMAWLESEMFRYNLIYKFFPASAMTHILYKDLSTLLSV